MTQPTLPFDICAHRHHGAQASVEANPGPGSKRATHGRILAILAQRTMTSKELAAHLGTPLNCLSGRLSELLAMGEIERTGDRRDGACVVRVARRTR